jgi:excinuclease ABC subunit C
MDAQWMQTFVDFGVDPLLTHSSLTDRIPKLARFDGVAERPSQLRAQLRDHVATHAPKCPGVYGMVDALGRLIYVGKSKLLRNRLLSYFLPGSRDEKAGRIVELARTLVWETQPSEFAALIREQSLIRRWQPTLNVVGMPNRLQSAFLCLGRGPAEQFYLTRQFDQAASACHGPFSGSGQLHRAIEILNRHFKLRDCSPKTPTRLTDQLPLFEIESRAGCLRAELGTCVAPCQAGASRAAYTAQEQLARRFLSGEPLDVVNQVEQDMLRAAHGCHYERAARLKEDLRIMKWLASKLSQHRVARESAPRIYWQPDEFDAAALANPDANARGTLYLIRHGGVEYSVSSPKNERQWNTIRRDIAQWLQSEGQLNTHFARSFDTLGLVAAWFQKHPKLKQRMFTVESLDQLPTHWKGFRRDWLTPVAA